MYPSMVSATGGLLLRREDAADAVAEAGALDLVAVADAVTGPVVDRRRRRPGHPADLRGQLVDPPAVDRRAHPGVLEPQTLVRARDGQVSAGPLVVVGQVVGA